MLAISDRSAGVKALALAGPPLLPAALACLEEADGSASWNSPVAMSAISFASWLGSRGRLGVFAMPTICHGWRGASPPDFKLTHYPISACVNGFGHS